MLVGSYRTFCLALYVCSELLDICSVIHLLEGILVLRAGLVLTQRRV